jgi:hypothetical protein
MLLSSTHFGFGGNCVLSYEESEQWLLVKRPEW